MSVEASLKENFGQARGVTGDAEGLGQLNIAIIGAGLVGLAAAAMLRKEGHRITVSLLPIFCNNYLTESVLNLKIFESSSFHAEIGAGITLTPNGVGVLKNLLPELNWENMKTVDLRSVSLLDHIVDSIGC
jgi:hypothetical protein